MERKNPEREGAAFFILQSNQDLRRVPILFNTMNILHIYRIILHELQDIQTEALLMLRLSLRISSG